MALEQRCRCFRIASLALALVLSAACSRGPLWSADEQTNSRHFFLSLEASQKAVQIERKSDSDVPQFDIEEINRQQRTALTEAEQVRDSVLDKAHPELKEHFRMEYQRGLEQVLSSYALASSAIDNSPSSAQVDLQARGVSLLQRWGEWEKAHRGEIRMPQRTVSGNKVALGARS